MGSQLVPTDLRAFLQPFSLLLEVDRAVHRVHYHGIVVAGRELVGRSEAANVQDSDLLPLASWQVDLHKIMAWSKTSCNCLLLTTDRALPCMS